MSWIHWMRSEPLLAEWSPDASKVEGHLFKVAMASGAYWAARALHAQGLVDNRSLELSFYELLMSGRANGIRVLRDEMGLDLNRAIKLPGTFGSLRCGSYEKVKVPGI
jgi:hypothetical protein